MESNIRKWKKSKRGKKSLKVVSEKQIDNTLNKMMEKLQPEPERLIIRLQRAHK